MAGYPDEVKQVFVDWKQEKLLKDLENAVDELQKRRVEYVEYGDPETLTPKKRAALNAKLLRQALLHRAECLLQAAGKMLLAKNVYGPGFGCAWPCRGYCRARLFVSARARQLNLHQASGKFVLQHFKLMKTEQHRMHLIWLH